MAKNKKTLTRQEEFEVLKLVLDKFLWVSVAILLYGLWRVVHQLDFATGMWILTGGVALLLVFMALLVREYEISR